MSCDHDGSLFATTQGVIPINISPHDTASSLAAFAAAAGFGGDGTDALQALLMHGQQLQADGKVGLKPSDAGQMGASSGASGPNSPNDPSSGNDPIVIIEGERDHGEPPWLPSPDYPDPGAGPIEGGSSGGGGEPHHTSPIPERHPSHVNMDHLRNLALDLSAQIQGKNPKVEWAAGIIADASGNLRTTGLIKGTPDSFHFYLEPSQMRPGDNLVAILHSHPKVGNQDAGIPSYTGHSSGSSIPDQVFINNLIEQNPNGWIHPHLMQYIVDGNSGTTYEFVGKGPDADRSGERTDISHDLQP